MHDGIRKACPQRILGALFRGLFGTFLSIPWYIGNLVGTFDDERQFVDLLGREINFTPKKNENEEKKEEVDYPDYSDNFHRGYIRKNIR
jgi:hypothetical protein